MSAAVTIEDLRPEEFERVAQWLSNPHINRWLTGEWRNRVVDSKILAITLRNRKNRLFLVRHGGAPVGLVGLADLDPADATGMIWYLLGESAYSGRGITTAAVRALVSHAVQDLGVRSLYAWAMAPNAASLRVLHQAGFRAAGRLRQSATLEGQQTDRVYFDLVAEEWLAAEGTTNRQAPVAAGIRSVGTAMSSNVLGAIA